jgi:hypothetical protein
MLFERLIEIHGPDLECRETITGEEVGKIAASAKLKEYREPAV